MSRAPLTLLDAIREDWFVCYECRAANELALRDKEPENHHCIGIPCMCPCPLPKPIPEEPEYSI